MCKVPRIKGVVPFFRSHCGRGTHPIPKAEDIGRINAKGLGLVLGDVMWKTRTITKTVSPNDGMSVMR